MGQIEKCVTNHPDFVYSSSNRILHWIRALVITGLIITGFYIAYPCFNINDGISGTG